jgi:hypothetical protein
MLAGAQTTIPGIPAERVREELEGILARSELRARESLLERLIDWLAPRLRTDEVRVVGDVLEALIVAAAVLVVLLLVRRAWLTFRAPGEEEAEAAATEARDARARVLELAAAARAARGRGDLRLALRLSFQALLFALGGRGDLELCAAWTNRELLRRGRVSRATRALLEPLVHELEPKEFGSAPVSAADLERLEALLAPHLAPAGGAA